MLNHNVTLTIPSKCGCGNPIPPQERKKWFNRVNQQFTAWFGGSTSQQVTGWWKDPNGQLISEDADVIDSSADDAAFNAYRQRVAELASEVARALHQWCVTYTLDQVRYFENGDPQARCFHGRTLDAGDHSDGDWERRNRIADCQGLEAALRRLLDPAAGTPFDRAFQLMVHTLGYENREMILPLADVSRDKVTSRGGRKPDSPATLLYNREQPKVITQVAGAFWAVVVRLKDPELLLKHQRPVLEAILKNRPTDFFLFLVTNPDGSRWHLVHPQRSGNRWIFRRFRIESKNQPLRTPVERLLGLRVAEGGAKLSRTDIAERLRVAFDVAALDKAFYSDFSRRFRDLFAAVSGNFRDEAEKTLFCQQVCNRLLFLTFVAHKGWLRYPAGTKEAATPDYFQRLWKGYQETRGGASNFYRDRLEKLFFEALRADRRDPAWNARLREVIGDAPFLNGGLFEPAEYDRVKNLHVPDAPIGAILNDLFARYNFTVTESTPFDQDVAVDPEMLGKLFERLVVNRHEKGAYYTPQNVVRYMCHEALKAYLGRACPDEDPRALERFVEDRDAYDLGDPKKVLKALEQVRVCDPACGSGAYLLGMLHELLDLQEALFNARSRQATRYKAKLDIIRNNLFGVDLEDFAVNIARLRLWLSLAVDYQGKEPKPLPNLDYRVETGDSLIGPAFHGVQGDLIRDGLLRPLIRKRRDLINKHFEAAGKMKEDYETGIQQVSRQIANILQQQDGILGLTRKDGKPVFAWDVQFCDVLDEGGFDIILANPPYVRQEEINRACPGYKDQLSQCFPDIFAGRADLLCYFYARAVQLLKTGGVLVFISSNKWFKADYGRNLRDYLRKTCRIRQIVDFGDLPVFEDATAYPMIFAAERLPRDNADCPEYLIRCAEPESLNLPYPDIREVVRRIGVDLPASQILREDGWLLLSGDERRVFDRMRQCGIPLGEYAKDKIHYGIKTGLNEAFVIDGDTRRRLMDADPSSAEIIRPLLRGRDIEKWQPVFADQWLICATHGTDISRYPAIRNHLLRFRERLEKRAGVGQHYQWFELQSGSEGKLGHLNGEGIVYAVISTALNFSLKDSVTVINDKGYNINIGQDLFLLGILNSSPASIYLRAFCPILQGAYELRREFLAALPIPDATSAQRKRVEDLVAEILKAKPKARESLERELDDLVAGLYGL
ncbi:MAG TPA: Eco57I restriction-modification methylase domain-containing protein [Candidatus Hydrogenedentes bacterium]|nr:Eco57I restriction-modification methylase domain-containing protein [Candidatus Hydrogenedentota bacterium]